MAARKKKRKPARRKRRSNKSGSFGSMMVGLVAGLSIAAVIWYLQSPERGSATAAPGTAAKAEPKKSATKKVEPVAIEATGSGYDFYDMLPEQEVVVSDDFAARRKPATEQATDKTEPVTEPGAYIIQAGSFRSAEDADSMKATLAILGMQARVEIVEIKDRVFHRVRIGPLKDTQRVNEFRQRLRDEQIDVILIRFDG